ncbi:polyhomeotic-like protein 2 isoform X2 [Pimephales promelas]|uniref:polyhomeotic-like protein 2 isoform X2 n=1 Tax=Pimephales promelas TaxID=90988 RepID=UPI001955C7D5|nr:polyhomeotic-like protein 2 isoform X2 [Pimephales promelas]KAG1961745.1 polyhomeotic-like protein 2 isoform a [Pimephales promelas]KAG1961746.1 polyhomeotic-like protein 2 isoform a [Pimephales promelas]KAG1961747.1 polyhomeotic-like protein 2 isoform a [Pimephales promelas]KAG1961748.1 polyhomeotic-like protein 2 isoform a [Pimephales promelas]
MEKEQGSVASSASVTIPSTTSASIVSNSSDRQQAVPQISVYGGITDRQTVQVIQQALNRQPSSAAAQYLQQMYAAQQQHLMLQTAALQQQHLSLAAVQQASIVAGRQSCNLNGTTSQQTVASQTTINLATSPAAAHLISRAQSGSSVPVCIAQQAVLLGNSSTPTLTASQAQMYLRAQMAQQTNLVQVARSLGRAVPLSPQLIFTPTASVTAVQSINTPPISGQVQNLALRGQQGVLTSSISQSQLQRLNVKQSPGASAQITLTSQQVARLKSSGTEPNPQGAAVKCCPAETPLETVGKNVKTSDLTTRELNLCPNVTSVAGHPLISTAYTQIQTHQLLQQHKHQFVIQQQPQILQRGQAQLLEAATHPHTVQAVAIQPALPAQPQQCPIPLLPKVPVTCQQATIFHSTTVSQQALAQNGQSPMPSHSKAAPLQLTAVNVQIQPVQTQLEVDTLGVSDKDNPDPLEPQRLSITAQVPIQTEQSHSVTENIEAGRVNVKAGVGSPLAMTSGSGNNAPTVTGSAPQNGESKPPPQAVVKPQILTHVIEGFVIQEGAEPFPVERPSLLIENLKKQKQSQTFHNADSEMEDLSQQELLNNQIAEPVLACEFCGNLDFAFNFKRSKRFCSTVCAKRYNVGCTKRMGLFPGKSTSESPKKPKASNANHQNSSTDIRKRNPRVRTAMGASLSSPHSSHPCHGDSSQCSDMSSYEEPISPLSNSSYGTQRLPNKERFDDSRDFPLLTQHFLASDPAKWNVEDVYEFICSLPGCREIAEEFRSQEIDGQALMLLKEDHLMSTMNIKLGPALKIFAHISMLKDS